MSKPSPTLLAMLALRQHRINQAEGVRRVTPQVGLLLAAYNVGNYGEWAAALAQAAYYNGLVQSSSDKIKALIRQAEAGDRETKIKALTQAQELEKLSERAAKELDSLDFRLRHRIGRQSTAQQ